MVNSSYNTTDQGWVKYIIIVQLQILEKTSITDTNTNTVENIVFELQIQILKFVFHI